MIRVLILHPTRTFGGAERTALNLIEGLDPKRFSVQLITGKEIAGRFPLERISGFTDFRDLGINEWYTRHTLRDMIKDSFKVRKLLKERKPDVALGMMYYASALLALAKPFGAHGAKIIASPRGPMEAFINTFFPNQGAVRLVWKMSFHLSTRLSDAVVVASNGLRDECVARFGANPAKVFVVNNGIDAEEVRRLTKERADVDIPKDSFTVVTMGRLAEEKNIPLLLKAAAMLKGKLPLKVIIVGGGPEGERLHAFAKELGINGDVLFTGYEENPFKYLSAADVYVHTCRLEGFGNSMVEAMAAGLPVLATDCPFGPREIVQDGVSGLLVGVDDAQALCRSIERLALDEALRKKLSEGARKRAERFSVRRMVEGYENVFKGLAEK